MTKKTLKAVDANGELESLVPIFRRWVNLIDDYSQRVHMDVPYGVGREIALAGFLLSAAHAKRWQGLMEFLHPKTRGKRRGGRSDLWLQMPSSQSGTRNRSKTFYFEAKVQWSDIDNDPELVCKHCTDRLVDAIEDARKVKVYRKETARRVGLVFTTIRGAAGSTPKIERAIPDMRRLLECDQERLVAWVFPGSKRGTNGMVGVVALAESASAKAPMISRFGI